MNKQIQILENKIRLHPTSSKVGTWTKQLEILKKQKDNNVVKPMKPVLAPPSIGDVDYKIVAPKIHELESKAAGYITDNDTVLKSILNFINPDTKQYRYPDSVTNPTNLLRSIREYLVYANFDGTPNAGRWSVAIQPSIGSLTDLSLFAVAIVDSSAGWPSDVYKASSYVSSVNGQDPRLDTTLLELLQSKTGAYAFDSQFSNYATIVGNDGFMLNPANGATTLLSSLKVSTEPIAGSKTFNGVGTATVINASYWDIPPGTYSWTIVEAAIPTFAGTASFSGWLAIDASDSLLGRIESDGVTTTGYFSTNAYFINEFNVQAPGTSGLALLESVTMNIRIKQGVRIIPYIRTGGGTPSYVMLNVFSFVSSVVDSRLASFDNSQMVSSLRPLGMSALYTNILPDLYAGGELVAYSAPSGDVRNLYAQPNSLGVVQNWEQLALLNKGNLMYDGQQKDGTFVFTQPWSDADLLLRTPDDFQAHPYQGIIISGQVSAGASLTGSQAVGRLRVITTYEYVTDSPIFTPKALVGDGAEAGRVLSFLSAVQHALPNNKHLAYLNKIVSTGSQILKGVESSVPILMKGLTAISSIM